MTGEGLISMRSWFKSRIAGTLLAVLMVAVTTSTAFADPRDFTLVNDTGAIITEAYVSPSNVTDWGDDVLGRDVLMPGENVDIVFHKFIPGNCLYDVKVVTDEGNEGELTQINLCETHTVTFN
jgi:hypothetical protein